MTTAYCTLEDVKSSLSGDAPNIGSSHDQSLVRKILEVSRDLDRQVAECRGDANHLFSFLADQEYGRQRVYLSATPAASDGTFLLEFGGEITGPIDHDAPASAVQDALVALSTVGDGNVAVTGFPGGPWTVNLAGDLSGPQPTISGRASVTPSDATIVVLSMVEGVAAVPSERFFRSSPPLHGRLIPIDDCVEILAVKTYGSDGAEASVLETPADWRPYPLRGLPIEAIKSTVDDWPEWPGVVGVTARWGHALAVPADVREASTIETIRSHLAGLAGNDDRVGMTPFGTVMTSKAFTAKTWQLVQDYGHMKLW